MKLLGSATVLLVAGITCQSAFAITDTVTINVSGTLTRPPCNVTSSKTLSVDFGSLRYDQVESAPVVPVPITLICPANSSLSVSIKASGAVSGSTTQATTDKANLAYTLTLSSDNSAVDITGAKRTLTKQNGNVDLSMKAKLLKNGELTEGKFSASTVINIEYL
ncbi:fimbrial protein [Pseudomonas sp. FW306-02-F02-AA]|uniref:Fimbrial protein n=1 Tax=Pseudomonas fluorescens TaxID=294 RepID=A0A0N9VW69_PSEFL|nr:MULTISPECIES: spore coat protein U domain-containing protein [Pseudomonas]ALI02891.1 fimbrial protein [Pseudomonas fluorescens]PMZ04323.1 fimbrial protein [Pseudomonas sp. FW306-02-F02-AB]PMZ10594.1 fimbrial protein [Pseudomonas sp. FW306-02-H06C]PMZ15988.1 fimbrial protein [Pseudomonas sp. FW306-02-F02-AA]PMZ21916.1 fimbrial protein [Pseudomonas sp. FW306-02-F08-AA]